MELVAINNGRKPHVLKVTDNAYQQKDIEANIAADATVKMLIPASKSHQWYDFNVDSGARKGFMRFAGRVETGKEGVTDPVMGNIGSKI